MRFARNLQYVRRCVFQWDNELKSYTDEAFKQQSESRNREEPQCPDVLMETNPHGRNVLNTDLEDVNSHANKYFVFCVCNQLRSLCEDLFTRMFYVDWHQFWRKKVKVATYSMCCTVRVTTRTTDPLKKRNTSNGGIFLEKMWERKKIYIYEMDRFWPK